MRTVLFAALALIVFTFGSCKKDDAADDTPVTAGPRLILKFKFDSAQVRLNGFGVPAAVPTGHAAQSPRFNTMSAHYVEFTPTALTAVGTGDVVYHAPETTLGGATAIDHDLGIQVGQNGEFLNIPLSDLSPGTYEYLRVSLAYQNYDIRLYYNNVPFNGTIASFIGYNTYISSFAVQDSSIAVNGNRSQGFWAFEIDNPPVSPAVYSGQAPGTTVVNPLFATSPIPAGSCLVTGLFAAPLVITGTETDNVVIQVSVSTNQSFEWLDPNANERLDVETGLETVVDMGVRGMIPTRQ